MRLFSILLILTVLGSSSAFASPGCATTVAEATTMIKSTLGQTPSKSKSFVAPPFVTTAAPISLYSAKYQGKLQMLVQWGTSIYPAQICAGSNSDSILVNAGGYSITISKTSTGLKLTVFNKTADLTPSAVPMPGLTTGPEIMTGMSVR